MRSGSGKIRGISPSRGRCFRRTRWAASSTCLPGLPCGKRGWTTGMGRATVRCALRRVCCGFRVGWFLPRLLAEWRLEVEVDLSVGHGRRSTAKCTCMHTLKVCPSTRDQKSNTMVLYIHTLSGCPTRGEKTYLNKRSLVLKRTAVLEAKRACLAACASFFAGHLPKLPARINQSYCSSRAKGRGPSGYVMGVWAIVFFGTGRPL